MPSVNAASNFLQVLNACHPSVSFTMEVENDGMLPFVGIQLLNKSPSINTKVFVKPTNKGLLLHYDSHVDACYKHCLVRTMLERAYWLSSSWEFFYWRMHSTWKCFSNLHYPKNHINRIVNRFVLEKTSPTQTTPNLTTVNIARVTLPFKDQKAADTVRCQLNDLGSKINVFSFQPVFLSKKLEDELKTTDKKPSIVNQQRVVYQFKCSFVMKTISVLRWGTYTNVVRNINLIRIASRNISIINTIVCLTISISTLQSYVNVRLNMTV